MLRRKYQYEQDSFATFMKTTETFYSTPEAFKEFNAHDFTCSEEEYTSILESETYVASTNHPKKAENYAMVHESKSPMLLLSCSLYSMLFNSISVVRVRWFACVAGEAAEEDPGTVLELLSTALVILLSSRYD